MPFAVVLASLVLFVSMARKIRGVGFRDRDRQGGDAGSGGYVAGGYDGDDRSRGDGGGHDGGSGGHDGGGSGGSDGGGSGGSDGGGGGGGGD